MTFGCCRDGPSRQEDDKKKRARVSKAVNAPITLETLISYLAGRAALSRSAKGGEEKEPTAAGGAGRLPTRTATTSGEYASND